MEKNIDALINQTVSLVGTAKKTENKKVKEKKTAEYRSKPQKDSKFTAQYKMDTKRTLIPMLILLPLFLILFPLLFIWIIAFISILIKMNFTRYIVKPNGMAEEYDFLSGKHKEFSNDKIMAAIVKENFIDRWFDTCSIHFWSIGSAEDIQFKNLKKSDDMVKNILAKTGVKHQESIYAMDSNFNFIEMLKYSFPVTIFTIVLIVVSLALSTFISPLFLIIIFVLFLSYIIAVIYSNAYYKRSKMVFFKDFVYFQRGIFFNEYYYALYDNIRDIITLKYPFSDEGTITFNVGGERLVQQGKNKSMLSNSFKIGYVDNIETKDELIDMIFYSRPSADKIQHMKSNMAKYVPKTVLSEKPALVNPVFVLVVFSVILFPLLILLPITLVYTIWSVKVKSYVIQPYRVLSKSGILYKKQVSIVFSKIDHINSDEGMLNKMFKNGNITVNTTGSSKPELVISNIPRYKNFYEVLKKHY